MNGLSIVFNLALFYLIIYHSDHYLKVYKRVLMATCLSDLTLSVIMLLGQPVVMFGGGYVLLFSNGFFRHTSAVIDFLAVLGECAGLHANVVLLVVQFVYRYLHMCKREEHQRDKFATVKLVVLPVCWCIVQSFVTAWFIYEPSSKRPLFLDILRNNSWPVSNDDTAPYPYGSYCLRAKALVYVGFYAITSGGGYVLIVWTELQIVQHLRQLGDTINRNTQKMHSEIHRALLALAICPLFTCVIPIFFFLYNIVTMSSPGEITILFSTAVTAITLFNPLTTTYFVKPYRNAVLNVFKRKKRNAIVAETTLAPTSQGGLSVLPSSEPAATEQ
ncbi:7TM GPCR protein [Aphelenchoides avenae]|nr:7TM GPCR protein [Aphelenchus avenae]